MSEEGGIFQIVTNWKVLAYASPKHHAEGTVSATLIGLGAAIIGSVTSLLTTWFGFGRWRAEKRHERRAELVDRWRKELVEGWGWQDNGLPDLVNKAAYSSLAPHLSAPLRREFEGTNEQGRSRVRTVWVREQDDKTLLIKLIAEIGRIEKKWGLV